MALDADTTKTAAWDLRISESEKMGSVYVHGFTMRPFLVEGDLITVKPVMLRDLHRGDVVVFRDGRHFPARRVVGIQDEKGSCVVRADNAPRRVIRLAQNDLVGKVIDRQRNGLRINKRSFVWRWARTRALIRHALIRKRRRFRIRIDHHLNRPYR